MFHLPPFIATLVYAIGICGLFWLARDRNSRFSPALIPPFIWLFVMSSRSITEWVSILLTGSPPTGVNQLEMYAEGTPLDRAVMIVLMLVAIAVLLHRGKLFPLLQTNLPMLAFFFFAGVSVIWSDFPDITIRRWFRAVGVLLMALVVLSERDRDAAMKRLFAWAGFILIPVSMLWIKYYPGLGRKYTAATISNWVTQLTGVAAQKNGLGMICLVFGTTFLWYLLSAYRDRENPRRTRLLVAYGAALGIVVWLFVLANSVTSHSCFLLAVCVLIATRTRTFIRNRALVHVLMFVLVAVPFAVLFLGVGSSVISALGRSETLTGRTEIWPKAIALVGNPLVGTGFESFWLGNRLLIMQEGKQFALNEAHNGFVEIYLNLGWIGLVLLAVLLVTGYRNVIACYRRDPDAGAFRLALLLSVVVSGFTEAPFRSIGIGWFSFLLITMSGVPRSAVAPVLTEDRSEPTEVTSAAVASNFRSNELLR